MTQDISATTLRAAASPEERRRLFRQYVEPRMNHIRNIIFASAMRGEDGDDTCQEVLLHLFSNIDRYDPAAGPAGPWVDTVVRNKMRRLRDHRRVVAAASPIVDLDIDRLDGGDDEGPQGVAGTGSHDIPDSHDTEYPRCHAALAALTPLQRRVLLLSAEGLPPRRIAEATGIAVANVAAALFRARRTMASRLRGRRVL